MMLGGRVGTLTSITTSERQSEPPGTWSRECVEPTVNITAGMVKFLMSYSPLPLL